MDNSVINTADQLPDWSRWDAGQVQKIVLGPTPDREGGTGLDMASLPDSFADRFGALTHLHLWGIRQLRVIPCLPENLACLDIRNCPDLERIVDLPRKLDTLIVEGCSSLKSLPNHEGRDLKSLREVSLRLGEGPFEDWIDALLKRSPALQKLDLSDCLRLARINQWPRKLVVAKLNGCSRLNAVPDSWPENLTRIELARTAIKSLPDLIPEIDYLNLAHASHLKALPKDWNLKKDNRLTPRTLFLYRSGLLVPPVSEQGEAEDDNVAEATRGYFEDVALVGKGNVKRCKLLMLGNGGAGKTSLSLRLVGEDPRRAEQLGSTHGVLFWDWACSFESSGMVTTLHRHIWDFGGQDIYHNAHRLFMGAGAVFLVLWDPQQDGKKAPISPSGYADEWRPLRYWLDFIHLACPHCPRIAVVCSLRHGQGWKDIQGQFKKQVKDHYAEVPLFQVDSWQNQGQIVELQKWIDSAVSDVVATQGTAVPAHWEVAQDMVEHWVKELSKSPTKIGNASHREEISVALFKTELDAAIQQAIASNGGRFPRLKVAIQQGTFPLTDGRIRRVLAFLTHSGWIFWNPDLFGERVIVSQKWALDGIYAALDRRWDSPIFKELRDRWGGQFTRQRLEELAWEKGHYSQEQQELLISFMIKMGICLTLVQSQSAASGEAVYLSLAHLKSALEADFSAMFVRCCAGATGFQRQVESDRLHIGDWNALLAEWAGIFGVEARYARDGFLVERNAEGQSLLILSRIHADGIGGTIEINVHGPRGNERAEEIQKQLEGRLRREAPKGDTKPGAEMSATVGTPSGIPWLFVSYARPEPDSPANGTTRHPVPNLQPIESPAHRIREALGARVKVDLDEFSLRNGDDIVAYMERIRSSDRVLIVHSQKYWKSPFCIYEFCLFLGSFLLGEFSKRSRCARKSTFSGRRRGWRYF